MAECVHMWSDRKITLLLQVLSKRSTPAQPLGVVQNKVPYWKITEELQKARFEHTHKQCRDKVKALNNAKKTSSTGCGGAVLAWSPTKRSQFLIFRGSLLSTMRDRAVANPHNVVDSATPRPSRVETEAGEESDEDYDAGIRPNPNKKQCPTSMNSRSNTPPNRAASPTDRTLLTDITNTLAIRTTTPVDRTTTPADRTTAPLKSKTK